MTQPMQMADFFAMEAGEYLERLDGMASSVEPPVPEDFHGLTRSLRGSALMAGQKPIARVASGLEALARGVKAGTFAWDEALRQLAIRAVDDLKVLVRAVNGWGTSEDARVQGIASELEKVAGTIPEAPGAVAQELDPGTRAFIAREGAAVGSALDLAAKTLARNPTAIDALDGVMRALQPLRGIASLSDLPPLPDLLDGIERAVQELMRRTEPPANPGAVFDAAAKAVSKASQDITAGGQADPNSPAATEFVAQLGMLLDMGPDVVPIESLYNADAGPHIVAQGARTGEAPGQLEIVSLAERLNQAAVDLESAQSNTQRQLRAHSLAPTLRALTAAGPEAAQCVNAIRDAIARGAAMGATDGLADQLRQAGSILTNWGQGQGAAQGLTAVAASIASLQVTPGLMPAPASPVAQATPAVPVAQAAPVVPVAQAAPVVPVAQAAPAVPVAPAVPPTAPVVQPAPAPAAASPPPQPAAENGLAASLDTYYQLSARATGEATLEHLLAGPPQGGEAAPLADPAEEILAPITQYCYSGEAAFRRVMELKEQLRNTVNSDPSELLEEIFDLVELGLRTPA